MNRSSEERSRFEKWLSENIPGFRLDRSNDHSPHAPDYIDHGTENSWAVWRAALEDRQEAAPKRMILFCPACGNQHIDEGTWSVRPHKTHQCQSCKLEWKPYPYPTVGILSVVDELPPGVPSEATPSKENAELKYENEQLMGCV